MSAFNTVVAKLECPNCRSVVTMPVQFKFGNTWQFQYEVGDLLRWGGNDIGQPMLRHVVVDGVAAGRCPRCSYDSEWNVYVHIENDRITRVENADGRFDFAASGKNYLVLA
jgi:hypothetical protein